MSLGSIITSELLLLNRFAAREKVPDRAYLLQTQSHQGALVKFAVNGKEFLGTGRRIKKLLSERKRNYRVAHRVDGHERTMDFGNFGQGVEPVGKQVINWQGMEIRSCQETGAWESGLQNNPTDRLFGSRIDGYGRSQRLTD